LEQVIVGEGIATSRIDWEPEPITTTADEALAADGGSNLALAEAENFLHTLLADGPVPSKQVDAEAQDAGITKSTLRRAKVNLGIKPYKDGMKGGWVCALPKAHDTIEDARLRNR